MSGGLQVTFVASVTRPAEIRTDEGRQFLFFNSVTDGVRLADETEARLTVAYFGSDIESLALKVLKYAEVRVSGRLSLLDTGGRTGLCVVAETVEVLQTGQVIGRISKARAT